VGAGASRLVCGTTTAHIDLQDALARFKKAEAAIVTSTGWQANACALSVLVREGDLVLSDKLNHASILDAARHSGATLRTYPHNDTRRLVSLLDKLRPNHRRCVIVTDGLFSMDGDVAPLAELVEVKKRYDAVLMVDDAHATGVLGANGRGSAELAGVEGDVDVTVGTLSKALGGLGGFVAGPRVLIEMIFNVARPFIYTTAPPPAMCVAAAKALEIVQREPQRRAICLANAEGLRRALRSAGLDVGASSTQIIPIIIGDTDKALSLSRRCFEAGFLVPAIRPPTVPPNSSRLRVTVMATHDWKDLARFAAVVAGTI
jgi:8-amino-7-oxononanoate synthase